MKRKFLSICLIAMTILVGCSSNDKEETSQEYTEEEKKEIKKNETSELSLEYFEREFEEGNGEDLIYNILIGRFNKVDSVHLQYGTQKENGEYDIEDYYIANDEDKEFNVFSTISGNEDNETCSYGKSQLTCRDEDANKWIRVYMNENWYYSKDETYNLRLYDINSDVRIGLVSTSPSKVFRFNNEQYTINDYSIVEENNEIVISFNATYEYGDIKEVYDFVITLDNNFYISHYTETKENGQIYEVNVLNVNNTTLDFSQFNLIDE